MGEGRKDYSRGIVPFSPLTLKTDDTKLRVIKKYGSREEVETGDWGFQEF